MSSGTAPARGIPDRGVPAAGHGAIIRAVFPTFSRALDFLKVRRAWLAGGAAFVLLVIYLSLTPDPLQVPNVGPFKAGHMAAYAWLMLWFAQLTDLRDRVRIGLVLVAMGIVLEYLQDFTGHRTFAYSDMRDNAIGVAIGFTLALTPLGGVARRFVRGDR
jgi:VanZ family protein